MSDPELISATVYNAPNDCDVCLWIKVCVALATVMLCVAFIGVVRGARVNVIHRVSSGDEDDKTK